MVFHSPMNFKRETIRKLFHLSGIFFLFLAKDFKSLSLLLLVSLIFIYLFSIFLEKTTHHGFPGVAQLTHFLKRGEKVDLAPPFLALGIIVCLLFFKFEIATCAILQICVGDIAASLIGQQWGKKKIFYSSEKTYLGSFCFFIAAFLVQLPFVSLFDSILLAFVGTLLESLPLKSFENLIVPLGVALFFYGYL